jgi:hypothetical protein
VVALYWNPEPMFNAEVTKNLNKQNLQSQCLDVLAKFIELYGASGSSGNVKFCLVTSSRLAKKVGMDVLNAG